MGRDAVFGHYLRDGEVKVLLQINQTIDWERSSAYSHFFLERSGSVRTPFTSLFLRQDLQVCIKHMIIAQFDHVPQIIPFEVMA
jgi:hypothetical protein